MPSLREACPERIEEIINRFPHRKAATIPLLYLAWEVYGYVSPEAMAEIAEILNLTPVQIQSIASFYTMFPLKPTGKYHLELCTNISCHLVGAKSLLKHLEKKLGIRSGETTGDGRFSLQTVECLAACSWAPCLHINGEEHQNLSPEKLDSLLEALP